MSRGPELATTCATAGPYLVRKLARVDQRLVEVTPRVLAPGEDDEAVHDLRVALRRTRTMLEVGGSVLGPFQADEVRRALKDIMNATGALRDEEVLRVLIGSLGIVHADAAVWLEGRARRERRLRGVLVRLVRGGALDRGRRLLDALLAFRVDPSRDRQLEKFARRAVKRRRRDVDRRREAKVTDPLALHRLRIAYKRLRYTVETFEDVLPTELAALAQPAARFQSRLGDLHDVDIAIGSVRRARLLSPECRVEMLAALDRERQARVAAYMKEVGVAALAPTVQTAAADSLRKASAR